VKRTDYLRNSTFEARRANALLSKACGFDVPVETSGDALDRYMIRVHDMEVSMKIIEQAIEMLPEGPFVVVAAQAPLAVKDGAGSVLVSADLDLGLDQMGTQWAFRDLQLEPIETHAILGADAALFLNAENLVEIDARDGDEGAAFLLGLLQQPRESGNVFVQA